MWHTESDLLSSIVLECVDHGFKTWDHGLTALDSESLQSVELDSSEVVETVSPQNSIEVLLSILL